MTTALQIYRFLRFKKRPVNGVTICKALGLMPNELKSLDAMNGVGSFGPCTSPRISPMRYARCNSYSADFIGLFHIDGRYWCIKERPLVRGARVPSAKRYKHQEL